MDGDRLGEHITVALAEGVDVDVELAGLPSRSTAFLADLALQVIALFFVTLGASALGDVGIAVAAVSSVAIFLGYPVVAEATVGQTFGKQLVGLRVTGLDGSSPGFIKALVRNVVRVIDALPGVYLVGCIAILASSKAQRLGDMAAGTLVVRVPRTSPANLPHLHAPEPQAAPVGWDVSMVRDDELVAIRQFLGRRQSLDPSHRAQLAQTLAFQVMDRVAGVPLEGGPEVYLERVAYARSI